MKVWRTGSLVDEHLRPFAFLRIGAPAIRACEKAADRRAV
jgi:hypothetical protein